MDVKYLNKNAILHNKAASWSS